MNLSVNDRQNCSGTVQMIMSKYTPGSVAKLLGAEVVPSGTETELQALFSKPPPESRVGKIQTKAEQVATDFISKKHPSLNSDRDSSLKKKRKYGECSREASLHDGMTRNSRHVINRENLRQTKSAADSCALTDHVLPAADAAANDDDVSRLSRRSVNAKNALMRIESKLKSATSSQSSSHDEAVNARTVFVGNVSLSVNKKALQRLFKNCGAIETLRIRSVPVADLKLPKKASVITKQFHPSRNSANAYVVFATEDAAVKALSLNGTELEGLHIRVNSASAETKHDHQKSVFIGNLPFDVEEESLRQHFTVCGSITNVRVIRDQKTGAGKGFGYVTFLDSSCVTLALSLDGELLNGHRLRVQRSTQFAGNKHTTPTLRRDSGPHRRPTNNTSTSNERAASVTHSASVPRGTKNRDDKQSELTEKPRQTLMKHKKMKEKTKKKLKRRREAKRKQSVSELLMKTQHQHS